MWWNVRFESIQILTLQVGIDEVIEGILDF